MADYGVVWERRRASISDWRERRALRPRESWEPELRNLPLETLKVWGSGGDLRWVAMRSSSFSREMIWVGESFLGREVPIKSGS